MFIITELLAFFAQESSFRKGYLEGSLLRVHLCHEKMQKDLSIVKVEVPDTGIYRSIKNIENSIESRIGVIGNVQFKLQIHCLFIYLKNPFI